MIRRTIVNVEQLDDRLCLSTTPSLTQALDIPGICHSTTVLAWARVDGTSPLNQQGNYFNGKFLRADDLTRESQRADAVFTTRSTGQGTTVADDVIVDGQIITAENYDGIATHGYIRIKKLNSGG
ncbi:MAG: hypothetical protein U0796_21615 [Gemmatales bacterium]